VNAQIFVYLKTWISDWYQVGGSTVMHSSMMKKRGVLNRFTTLIIEVLPFSTLLTYPLIWLDEYAEEMDILR